MINDKPRRRAPARNPDSRENQLVSLAVDLAERQLRDGTASSQVIAHYLKVGSSKERIEKDILLEEKKLKIAKTEALQSSKRVEELYKEAMDAMRSYSGSRSKDDD